MSYCPNTWNPYRSRHFSTTFKDKYAVRAAELREEARSRIHFWGLWCHEYGASNITDRDAFLAAYYDKYFPEETEEAQEAV